MPRCLDQLFNRFGIILSYIYRIVNGDINGTGNGADRSFRHDFGGAVNGNRNDGDAGFERQVKGSFFKRNHLTVRRSRSLGIDDVTLSTTDLLGGITDAFNRLLSITAIDPGATHPIEARVQNGNSEDFFFHQEGNPAPQENKHQGCIKPTLVVGNEDVGLAWLQLFQSLRCHPQARDLMSQPTHGARWNEDNNRISDQ